MAAEISRKIDLNFPNNDRELDLRARKLLIPALVIDQVDWCCHSSSWLLLKIRVPSISKIIYALALAEALLFLTEKAYWEWKVMFQKVLQEVNDELDLGASGMISIKRFFYDSYSRCVNGSIFYGLKMDVVTFAMELLASDSPDEQLIGIRTLRLLTQNDQFSDDTLRKIGITLSVIERLVEMLNWKDPQEEEIRLSAAEILSMLAGKKQSSLRFAGIPGVMESISSLLQTNRIYDRSANDHPTYAYWKFNHLGLVILKKLARDHNNCGKIGNTRGLLPKIVDFTRAEERVLMNENLRSLKLVDPNMIDYDCLPLETKVTKDSLT